MNRPVGDTLDRIARFKRLGVLTSPTTVTVTVKHPDGTVTTPGATELSEGVFHIAIPVIQEGIAYYRVEGIGNDVDAVAESSFCGVASSVVSP